MRKLLLGNEALAQGAIDAGLSGVYAYPGTPSTEITTYIQNSAIAKELGIHSAWSINEKTAMEAALGMSYAGKRAMVVMKHVGLNVAADIFMNAAISGVNGGMVVVVADDPSMHSSQNEQDSRFYGKFAMVPIFEPSNQQEAYEIMSYAFDFSERIELPIMVRMTTRLSHSRAGVITGERRPQNENSFTNDPNRFILIPSNARPQYKKLLAKQEEMETASNDSRFNRLIPGEDTSLGIIACGLGINYLMENFEDKPCPHPVLKISQYPLPRKMIQRLFDTCDKILVVEEGAPFVEEMITDYLRNDDKVTGRLTRELPREGELNPNVVAKALGIAEHTNGSVPDIVAGRPPELCVGCGHRDLYDALNELKKEIGEKRIFSDIGCYALGALPPYQTIDTVIDMGASITMAKGAADAGIRPSVAVIGDSTFTHSGMTGLLDCVIEQTPVTIIISDNSAVAMTGAQESGAFGRLEQICLGIGVAPEHLKVIVPLKKNHEENVNILREEMNYNGVSVVIARRECIHIPKEIREKIKALG